MNFQSVSNTLKQHGLSVFTTQEFVNLFQISPELAAVKLSRYKKAGYLSSPRRSIYYLTSEVENLHQIANKAYSPSYISMDSALSYYHLIPETVYTITSVTPKTTREFSDHQTVFHYYKIKLAAFTGYTKQNDVFMAEKEKAVVDYLYFVALGKRRLNDRLDLTDINRKKIIAFASLFAEKRLNRLLKLLW
jgi:predicted transcriptional regulator of viral defense system